MNPAQVFNPRLVLGLIAAGIVAFAAMLLLIAYGGNMGSSRDGRAHALSVGSTGYRGLVALTDSFYETRFVRSEEEEGDDLLIVSIEESTQLGRVTALLERRSNRPTMLILPKWMTMPHPSRRGWVQAVQPGSGRSALPLFGKDAEIRTLQPGASMPARALGEQLLAGLSPPVPASPQVIGGSNLTPLITLSSGDALVAQIGVQPHYVVADPDLLNNHGLRDPERARTAIALIQRFNAGRERVDFDLTMNGIGAGSSRSLLQLAFEAPFLVMTLALLAAALLAGFHGAFRFGPARREERAIAFGKAALVENSAGLIRLAEREARLGGSYVDVVRQETARMTGAPYWLQGERLDRYLDRLNRPGRPNFSELAAQLYGARDRHGLMAAARALALWKKEIIG